MENDLPICTNGINKLNSNDSSTTIYGVRSIAVNALVCGTSSRQFESDRTPSLTFLYLTENTFMNLKTNAFYEKRGNKIYISLMDSDYPMVIVFDTKDYSNSLMLTQSELTKEDLDWAQDVMVNIVNKEE